MYMAGQESYMTLINQVSMQAKEHWCNCNGSAMAVVIFVEYDIVLPCLARFFYNKIKVLTNEK